MKGKALYPPRPGFPYPISLLQQSVSVDVSVRTWSSLQAHLVVTVTCHMGSSEPWIWAFGLKKIFDFSLTFHFTWCVCILKFSTQAGSWRQSFLFLVCSPGFTSIKVFRFFLCPRENSAAPGWDALGGGKGKSWKVEHVFLAIRKGIS